MGFWYQKRSAMIFGKGARSNVLGKFTKKKLKQFEKTQVPICLLVTFHYLF